MEQQVNEQVSAKKHGKIRRFLGSKAGRVLQIAVLVAAIGGVFAVPTIPKNLKAAPGTGWTALGDVYLPDYAPADALGACVGAFTNVEPNKLRADVDPQYSDYATCYETPEMPVAMIPVMLIGAGLVARQVRKRSRKRVEAAA